MFFDIFCFSFQKFGFFRHYAFCDGLIKGILVQKNFDITGFHAGSKRLDAKLVVLLAEL